MAETLPPIAMSFSPQQSEEPRIRRIQFGDGYEARIQDGLNPISMKISATWQNLSHPNTAILLDFFRRHGAVRYFLHTPHGEGIARKFVCPKWSYTRSRDSAITSPRFDLTAEFYEVHDLGT